MRPQYELISESFLNIFHDITIPQSKLEKAIQMFRNDRLAVFVQMSRDTMYAVVRSQRDSTMFYASWLRADGSYCCHSCKLNACGGLRGSVCKHILTAVGYIVLHSNPATHIKEILHEWLVQTFEHQPSTAGHTNKQNSSFVFQRYIESTGENVPGYETLAINPMVFTPIQDNDIHQYTYYTVRRLRGGRIRHGNGTPEQLTAIRSVPEEERLSLREQQTTQYIPSPTVKILDDTSTQAPLLELHQATGGNILSDENLHLNYLMCIGDRIRVKETEIANLHWKQCSICKFWYCAECAAIIIEEPSCFSSMNGFQAHKARF